MGSSKNFETEKVVTISAAHFIHDIYSSFLAPILPLLIEKLSISYSLAGFLTVIQRLPSLLNPFMGLIADKISVRYLLITSPALTAIVMSLLGIAPTYTFLAILLFVMGLSASMFHVPAPVMIKHISGARIGKGMSFFMLGGEIARTIGPLVILGGVSIWGLEGTYRLFPFGILASIILFFKFKNIKISHELKITKEKTAASTFKKHLPMFITIAGITFFNSIIKGALTAFLPTFLTSKGDSLWYGGISLSLLQLAGAAGTFMAGTISDKIGRKRVLIISAIANPFLMILFVFSGNFFSFPILILLGFFLFAFTPVLMAIVNETKSEFPAFLNGIYMTINFLTGAITISIIGFSADFINLESTFYIAGLLGFFCIPFILKLKA